jgi:hypothetical protein
MPGVHSLKCDLIITSTLTRAMETASIGLEFHWKERKVPFIALEDAHEQAGVHTCDFR